MATAPRPRVPSRVCAAQLVRSGRGGGVALRGVALRAMLIGPQPERALAPPPPGVRPELLSSARRNGFPNFPGRRRGTRTKSLPSPAPAPELRAPSRLRCGVCRRRHTRAAPGPGRGFLPAPNPRVPVATAAYGVRARSALRPRTRSEPGSRSLTPPLSTLGRPHPPQVLSAHTCG